MDNRLGAVIKCRVCDSLAAEGQPLCEAHGKTLWFDWTIGFVGLDKKGRRVDVYREGEGRVKEFVGYRFVNGKWVEV